MHHFGICAMAESVKSRAMLACHCICSWYEWCRSCPVDPRCSVYARTGRHWACIHHPALTAGMHSLRMFKSKGGTVQRRGEVGAPPRPMAVPGRALMRAFSRNECCVCVALRGNRSLARVDGPLSGANEAPAWCQVSIVRWRKSGHPMAGSSTQCPYMRPGFSVSIQAMASANAQSAEDVFKTE